MVVSMMSKCIPPSLSLTSLRPVWYMPLLLRPIPCFCMLSNLVHFGCASPAPPRDGQCAGGQEANKFTLRGFGCFEHFYLTDPKRRAHITKNNNNTTVHIRPQSQTSISTTNINMFRITHAITLTCNTIHYKRDT